MPQGADESSYPGDLYLVAIRLCEDAVLSHHTALEYHGRAYSVWQQLIHSPTRPPGRFVFRSRAFRGVNFPESLLRSGRSDFRVVRSDRTGIPIRVASLERTMVDILHRPDLARGWEEIWRSLESVEFLEIDRVAEYALLLGDATTVAKVGFFLEERHLKPVRYLCLRQPHYLDRSRRVSGHHVPRWNLVAPADVIRGGEAATAYGERLVNECRQGLSSLLPSNEAERAFLDLLVERGEIDATNLTQDPSLQERIQAQPLVERKAINVRRRMGLIRQEGRGRRRSQPSETVPDDPSERVVTDRTRGARTTCESEQAMQGRSAQPCSS